VKRFVLFFFLFVFTACTTPQPLLEYTLARTAMEAARNVDAVKYAPSHWYQATEYYRTATLLFKEKKYDDAKNNFDLARVYAEKAENLSRLKKFKSGEL
jgi:hypothetical protein